MNRYDLAAQEADHRLWDWDLTTSRIHYSPGWVSLLGCDVSDFGNTPEEWFRRIHPDDIDSVQREIDGHLAQGSTQFEIQHRMLHQDGCYRWMSCRGMITRDPAGKATRITGFHVDITAEKVVDPLTGLPNRLLLLERLSRSIDKARKREDFLYAVLIIDLSLFEAGINRLDTVNSDPLVIAAARRLETSLRVENNAIREGKAHLIARSGGEEFIVLLEGLGTLNEARKTADHLLKALLVPFDFNGRNVFLTPSIGIALSATGYRIPEDALRDADTALYRARSLGKSRCEVFDTAVLEMCQTRTQLEQDLQTALLRSEFVVHYQPIVSLADNRIAGFEALVRWNHPSRGMVPPMEFIPVAEKSGLIIQLDRWVLEEACRQVKAWRQTPGISQELWVSVNVTGAQFMQPSFVSDIRKTLLELDFDASGLMLELTEGVVMENPEAARTSLMQLRAMGARIGLDDFGTGYSSLAHLRRFPVDYLKIDYSFVRGIENSSDTLEIIRAIAVLSKQLGLHVVAEGIENARQLEIVKSLQCEFGQGFLFSRAVTAKKAEELLLQGFPREAQEGVKASGAAAVRPAATGMLPASAKSRRLILNQNRVWAGLAFIVLVAGSLLATWNGGGNGGTVPVSSTPKTDSAAASLKVGTAEPALPSPTKSKPASAVLMKEASVPVPKTVPATPKTVAAETRPAKEPAPAREWEFAVVHDHFAGSCTGTLKFSRDRILYAAENGKDSFDYPYPDLTYILEKDWLTFKSDKRTYRFKSAGAQTKEENRSVLSEIYQKLSSLQPE